MALPPTTALREPANYGLRGWISTRSSDLAQVLLHYLQGRLSGRIVRRFRPSGRGCFGDLSRERERHEDVEGPDRPAVAGVSGGRHGACGRRGGICRIGGGGAGGIKAAGNR